MDDSCYNKEICENCVHSAYYLSERICLLKDKSVNDEDPKCDDFKNGYFIGRRTTDDISLKDDEYTINEICDISFNSAYFCGQSICSLKDKENKQ